MGVLDYFTGSDKQRAKFIFDLIAPVYGLIDSNIQKNYIEITKLLNDTIPLSEFSILDVGTGTGGWLASIAKYSDKPAEGCDFSTKMLKEAKKRHTNLKFTQSDALTLNNYQDKSFDIVTASFVLHGMKESERAQILIQMKRIARKYVMIHDFYGKIHPVIIFLEHLEKSDYKHFKANFKQEITTFFEQIKIITSNNGSAVYTGILNN